MTTIDSFGARLAAFRAANKLTQKDFSDRIGVSRGYLASIETGRQEPSYAFLKSVLDTFDVSSDHLITGNDGGELAAEFVPIPRYTVSASAGDGDIAGDFMEVSYYAFSADWLRRRQLDPKMLHIVEVRGDSMEPKLIGGDLILIDRAQVKPVDGNTYVVRLGEELVVKNMQRIDRETILLISNNPIYPPRQVSGHDIGSDEQVDIIGRVIASMHEW